MKKKVEKVVGENKDRKFRISSVYCRDIYNQLFKISEEIDFTHHDFIASPKRSRSYGSAQALIVETCLKDDIIRRRFTQLVSKYLYLDHDLLPPSTNHVCINDPNKTLYCSACALEAAATKE